MTATHVTVGSMLVTSEKRQELAAALIEYRNFVRDNPTDELAPLLGDVIAKIRENIRERRRVERSFGWELRRRTEAQTGMTAEEWNARIAEACS